MHYDWNADIDRRLNCRSLLEDISYKSQVMTRWSIKAHALMTMHSEHEAREYLKLLLEDAAELAELIARISQVSNAASVQDVSRETDKEAA